MAAGRMLPNGLTGKESIQLDLVIAGHRLYTHIKRSSKPGGSGERISVYIYWFLLSPFIAVRIC